MKIQYRILIVIVFITSIIIVIELTMKPTIPITSEPVQIKDQWEDVSPASYGDSQTEHVEVSDTEDSEEKESIVAPVIDGQPVTGTGNQPVEAEVDTPPNPDSEETLLAYDSIVGQANEQIISLQASCQSTLINVYSQYVGSNDVDERKGLIAQAKAELARCDVRFDEILIGLETALTTNKHPTVIIGTYRAEYAQQKALAQSIVN